MAKNTTEGVNFKIVMPHGDIDRLPCKLQTVTLEKVCRFIDEKEISPKIKAQLKKMAGTYPEQALENWVNNFSHHLTRARRLVKQQGPEKLPELGEEKPNLQSTDLGKAPTLDEFA